MSRRGESIKGNASPCPVPAATDEANWIAVGRFVDRGTRTWINGSGRRLGLSPILDGPRSGFGSRS